MWYSIGMRAWLIIVLMAAFPFHTQNNPSFGHQRQAKESIYPTAALYIQVATAPQQDGSQNKQDESLCERLLDALVSQWPLVLLGIATLFVVGYQAREMARATQAMHDSTKEVKRQADIMERQTGAIEKQAGLMERQASAGEKAATAAFLNAQTMINSERARLALEFVPMSAIFGGQWQRIESYGGVSMSKEEVAAGKHLSYQLKVTNLGRTPAEMFAFNLDWGMLNEGRKFSTDDLSNHTRVSINQFLGEGESRILYVFNTEESFVGLGCETKEGAVCATVEYADTVSTEAERKHTSFVFYHYPKSMHPLERINAMTRYD